MVNSAVFSVCVSEVDRNFYGRTIHRIEDAMCGSANEAVAAHSARAGLRGSTSELAENPNNVWKFITGIELADKRIGRRSDR